ncbi:MAG: nucleotidyltransferase family protein [Gloeobacteraceae cyanobacterium ES-bin-316]|nr:nucleotidyltransferase family protein [Ferruginibacter sp.]
MNEPGQNLKITEAIILAGGLGTRLKAVSPGLPKSLVNVAGKPFLHYIIQHLQAQGIKKFHFALGHLHESIKNYLHTEYPELDFLCSVEKQPLGTGGAVRLAGLHCLTENVLVVNGDTLFEFDLEEMAAFHFEKKASCTMVLKPMQDFDRYGVVEINTEGEVTCFKEKEFTKNGLINAGAYILSMPAFLKLNLPLSFSFERDYLQNKTASKKPVAVVQNHYFIDIGIPEDLEKARKDLAAKTQ